MVYEAAGRAATGIKIRFHATIAAANQANLLEDSERKLKVQNDSLQFDLHPFEIKTIKIQLKGARMGR